MIGNEINRDYGEFCLAAVKKKADATESLRDLPTRNIYFKNLTFEQSPVRLASCRAVMFDQCTFHQPENRDEGAVDAAGKKVMEWKRRTPVTGIMGLQGIWLRDCDFRGCQRTACISMEPQQLHGGQCQGQRQTDLL